MHNGSNIIEGLILSLAQLPGLGHRSARRIVLYLMQDKEIRIKNLCNQLGSVLANIVECQCCGNLDVFSVCGICQDSARDSSIIAVVESVADLWALERSRVFKGWYHVLGKTLSAVNGNDALNSLKLPKLLNRIHKHKVQEIILATNSTIDGQMTAFFVIDYLKDENLKISKLAAGIPLGGELDYLDEGTLLAAFKARQSHDLL
ncbi:recombination protein RecR [Orientia chuto str. Dubai]|uniref:Recombination protein RecR n=1 Tax=Orientia chuto str. Dubai TaxID=1359168 RepID=A0A0F3MP78_9RICK|nr:recombination mediator RecR [Candidatus Orientia mediorientalis]KJV57553.1 recombination protein RecR [Orientia chuto str. Dubai]